MAFNPRASARSTSAAQLDSMTNRCTRRLAEPPTTCGASTRAHSANRVDGHSAAPSPWEHAASACATVMPRDSPSSMARGQHSRIRAPRSDGVAPAPPTTMEGHAISSCRHLRRASCSRPRLSAASPASSFRSRRTARHNATRVASNGQRGKCTARKRPRASGSPARRDRSFATRLSVVTESSLAPRSSLTTGSAAEPCAPCHRVRCVNGAWLCRSHLPPVTPAARRRDCEEIRFRPATRLSYLPTSQARPFAGLGLAVFFDAGFDARLTVRLAERQRADTQVFPCVVDAARPRHLDGNEQRPVRDGCMHRIRPLPISPP